MTQPVQEPSQGRTDQGQAFRTRQLFRRPSPSPSPGSWAQVRLDNIDANQAVGAGVTTQVNWEHFNTTDGDTFATGSGATSTVVSNTAGDKTLILRSVGVYIITLFVDWIAASPDYVHSGVLDTNAFSLDYHGITITNQALTTTAPDGASDQWLNDGYIYQVPSGSEPCWIRADVTNGGVASHDVKIATMAAVYLPITADYVAVYG